MDELFPQCHKMTYYIQTHIRFKIYGFQLSVKLFNVVKKSYGMFFSLSVCLCHKNYLFLGPLFFKFISTEGQDISRNLLFGTRHKRITSPQFFSIKFHWVNRPQSHPTSWFLNNLIILGWILNTRLSNKWMPYKISNRTKEVQFSKITKNLKAPTDTGYFHSSKY